MARNPIRMLVAAAFIGLAGAAQAASPVGQWRTIDDETNQERSVVEITLNGGELRGQVMRFINPPDGDPNKVCSNCEGDNKGKPIVGMTILWGLKENGGEWSGGSILDPKTGKIYKATIKVADDGQKLTVRGYIGISLIGRTQVWSREK